MTTQVVASSVSLPGQVTLSRRLRDVLALGVFWKMSFGAVEALAWFSGQVLVSLLLGWLALCVLTDQQRLHRALRGSVWLVVFVAINILFDIGASGEVSREVTNFSLILVLSILGNYYREAGPRFKRLVLTILCVDTLILMYVTSLELRGNPNVVRQASTAGGVSATHLDNQAGLVASYSLIYALVILVVFAFSLSLWLRGMRKLWVMTLAGSLAWWVFSASFAISLLVLIVFALVAVLDRCLLVGYGGKVVSLLLIVGLVLLMRGALAEQLGQLASSGMVGDVLSGKALDFATGLVYGSDAMANTRGELYARSLQVFLDNPLLGVHSIPLSFGVIGGHSGWLDGLGSFGLLRFLFFVAFVFSLRRPQAIQISSPYRAPYELAFLAIIAVGFVNPIIFPQPWVVLLVIIPFWMPSNAWLTPGGVGERRGVHVSERSTSKTRRR